ncbi:LacI family DNA-binding transcriptional regulator [Thalassobacillus pellis]|uniref:LacI family DNA-binding transcriptional regulator n=1 Tax=Thalassobacillus pellis TaxID=748008 RepID=UPI00195F40EC|nr:substrate-binding domain-containing protein [Thalassobacillus pellis]MBM7552017.1 LacI family kdg operon repressor [Thalassobacillus pellis]
MKPVTIADVALHAKVSKSTVSQFLNKRYDYMGEKTKQRIEQAIKDLGYQPNYVARSLKQKSTKTIGVIVANILHNFSTEVSRAIEDACNEHGFHLIVCNADDNPEKEKKYMEMLRAKQVDGIIIFPTGGNKELYQKMLDEKYPVVFVDREVQGIPVSSIMLENKKAARLAVEHFIERGYKRIGIMTTSIIRNLSPRVERIEGYKEAMNDNGLPVQKEYMKSLDLEQIQDGMKSMLSLKEPPEAVVAGNDLALIEILKYVKQNRLKIPEDLAVIGIDDVSFASFYTPSITTVAQPTFEMGKKAADVLLTKISKKQGKDNLPDYRFEPQLMVRDSVGYRNG